jgi:hypothetical protein
VFDGVLTLVVGAGPSSPASLELELELPQPTAANSASPQAPRRATFTGYPPP